MKREHVIHIVYICLFLAIFTFCYRMQEAVNTLTLQVNNLPSQLALQIKTQTKVQAKNFAKVVMKNPCSFLHKVIMKENLRKYTYVLNRKIVRNVSQNPYPNKIWFYWSDGVKDAPKIVHICLKSIKKYIPNMEIVLVDKNNVKKYVKLPKHILQKYEKKIICEAHFSDIVRVNLLNKYGGLWLDSTIFLTGALPRDIFKAEFFAPSLCDINPKKSPGFKYRSLLLPGVFCNYLMYASKPHNYVVECMVAFLNEYWKDRNWADYFLFYEFTAVAIEEDKKFFDVIVSMLRNHYYPEQLFLNLNTNLDAPYNQEIWNQIKEFPIHKICQAASWHKRKIVEGTFAEKLSNEELAG